MQIISDYSTSIHKESDIFAAKVKLYKLLLAMDELTETEAKILNILHYELYP